MESLGSVWYAKIDLTTKDNSVINVLANYMANYTADWPSDEGSIHPCGKRFEHEKIKENQFYESTKYDDSGVQRRLCCACYCCFEEHGFENIVADMKGNRRPHPTF